MDRDQWLVSIYLSVERKTSFAPSAAATGGLIEVLLRASLSSYSQPLVADPTQRIIGDGLFARSPEKFQTRFEFRRNLGQGPGLR